MNIVTIGRRASGKITNPYLMTKDTNPEVLAVCYAQGWCASLDYMTYEEASAVTDIGTAFANNKAITHFEELEHFGIKSIPTQAFFKCTNLAKIILPDGMTIIDKRAFNTCTALATIDIPNSVTAIGGDCFTYSRITKITIGTGIKSIATWALASISALRNVTIRATVPPNITVSTFSSSNNALFYVPANSINDYKSANIWSNYADRIFAIPTNSKK